MGSPFEQRDYYCEELPDVSQRNFPWGLTDLFGKEQGSHDHQAFLGKHTAGLFQRAPAGDKKDMRDFFFLRLGLSRKQADQFLLPYARRMQLQNTGIVSVTRPHPIPGPIWLQPDAPDIPSPSVRAGARSWWTDDDILSGVRCRHLRIVF